MATVGGIACTFLRAPDGSPPAAIAQEVELWRVQGLNGYGIAWLGLGNGEFRVSAVFISSNAGVDAWASSLRAKQGTAVSILDDAGGVFSNCVLVTVGAPVKTPWVQPGTGVSVRGEIQISGVRIA